MFRAVATWMVQLALRDSRVPVGWRALSGLPLRERLLQAFLSILPFFQRTYIILDGLDSYLCGEGDDVREGRADEISAFIQPLLEQDFGNVSIAIFSRPERSLDLVFDLADVSIRLLKAEPSPDTLRGYCRSRMDRKVEPELVAAGFRQPKVWLDDIETAICNASDGL